MDFLIPNGQNTIENNWPDELSIEQIAVRSAPNDLKKQAGIRYGLIDLCKSGTLKFYGSISGWKYINGENPYPRATGRDDLTTQEIVRGVIPSASGRHCLIHKDNFKSYLQSIGKWPLQNSPMINWWLDGVTIKPRDGGYFDRDVFAINLVKDRPELLAMRPGEIKKELQDASSLFFTGYGDWWRGNPIFPKGKPGAPKKR